MENNFSQEKLQSHKPQPSLSVYSEMIHKYCGDEQAITEEMPQLYKTGFQKI